MDELIAFVRRCLDDDERSINDDREIGEQPTFPYRQLLDDIKAKRRILDRYEDSVARQQEPEYSQIAAHIQAEEYQDWIIPALAQPYAGRAGWQPEWADTPQP